MNLKSGFTLIEILVALLAASIIGNSDSKIRNKLKSWRLSQTKSVKKNPK